MLHLIQILNGYKFGLNTLDSARSTEHGINILKSMPYINKHFTIGLNKSILDHIQIQLDYLSSDETINSWSYEYETGLYVSTTTTEVFAL